MEEPKKDYSGQRGQCVNSLRLSVLDVPVDDPCGED